MWNKNLRSDEKLVWGIMWTLWLFLFGASAGYLLTNVWMFFAVVNTTVPIPTSLLENITNYLKWVPLFGVHSVVMYGFATIRNWEPERYFLLGMVSLCLLEVATSFAMMYTLTKQGRLESISLVCLVFFLVAMIFWVLRAYDTWKKNYS